MPRTLNRAKVWYQSFVDPHRQAAYFKTLTETVEQRGGNECCVRCTWNRAAGSRTASVDGIPLPAGSSASGRGRTKGYDAFAIGHFQDGGLYEARATVDIPVLGLGEAAMLYACALGQKIGLATINPVFVPMHEEQIRRYGLTTRIVAVKAIETDPAMLVRAFTDKRTFEKVLRQFRAQVEPLVANGIEVVIPAGGLPSPLFSRIKIFRVGLAVVLDCIAVLAKMAQLAVALQRFHGTGPSHPPKP